MDDVAPYRVVARNIDPDADNAIHDDDVARRYGFTGALVPGVELFACATSPLVAAWGQRWLEAGRIDLRFRRPVYDGEELLVELRDGALTVTGPDGEVRCTGSAGLDADPPPARRGPAGLDLVDAPLPAACATTPRSARSARSSSTAACRPTWTTWPRSTSRWRCTASSRWRIPACCCGW
jgi:hypothetical protein